MKQIKNDGFISAFADSIAAKVKELLGENSSREDSMSLEGKKYMTAKEVCDYLRISRATLYRHRDAGFITPSIYVGRKPLFTHDDIEAYVKNFS